MFLVELLGEVARSNADLTWLAQGWEADESELVSQTPGADLFYSDSGGVAAFHGPDAIAVRLRDVTTTAALPRDPEVRPDSVALCRDVLDKACPIVQVDHGPNYAFPEALDFAVSADIRRSDRDDGGNLLLMQPPNLDDAEWHRILTGRDRALGGCRYGRSGRVELSLSEV